MEVIAWSIPAFMLAIAIELVVARRRQVRAYRFSDTVTDLNCGMSSEAMKLVTVAVTFGLYVLVYERWSLITWDESSPWPWIVGLVGLDFLYYWWHRGSHVSNLLWAAHVVHHQSEDYNLAVALRQAWFTSITLTWFYLPLAFLGVPPTIYAISSAVSLLYQFWIHTELIAKMPRWFEWLLNTPSHHRVHHAINPQYLDKNYAAIFMVWDRMFGTFAPEIEPPVYGIRVPLDSWNVAWANVHRLVEVGRESLVALAHFRFAQAAWVWFAHPSWHPTGVEVPAVENQLDGRAKFETPLGRGTLVYVVFWMVALFPSGMLLLLYSHELTWPQRIAAVATLVMGTATIGGLMQRKRWAVPLEALRLVGAAVAVSVLI